MRMCIMALTVLVVLTIPVVGQDLTLQHHTNPIPPSRDTLDRLNLDVGWRVHIPVEGRGDGLFTVQRDDKELFVQTQKGLIVCLNAETGQEYWRNRVASAYRPTHALGFNKTTIFIVNGAFIFALDRASGNTLWEFPLPSASLAAPVADERQVYLSLGSKNIMTYIITSAMPGRDKGGIPSPAAPRSTDSGKKSMTVPLRDRPSIFERGSRTLASIGPLNSAVDVSRFFSDSDAPLILLSGKITDHFLEETPLQINDALLFPCADGGALAVAKVRPVELFFFETANQVTAAAGQFRETAFIASQDHNLTALSMVSGKSMWRFASPAPFLKKPEVTDDYVFATPERSGMYCLSRVSGDVVWTNPQAERFLSMNPKFVYALDRSGRLMVLDRKRGTTLAGLNTHDFVFPIANEDTDRFILAANNGLMICLHDKEFRTPFVTKTPEPVKKPEDK